MALTITKAYSATNILLEAHIDNFRSGLHTQFNTDKFGASQFDAGMALTADKFSGSWIIENDNSTIDFGTGSDASLGLDASKNFVFSTAAAATEICFYATSTYYMEFYTDKLHLPGDVIFARGGANRTLFQALSTYKKPVLTWEGANEVGVDQNSGTTNETVIFFPNGPVAVTEVKTSGALYRQAAITATANGYGTADTGAVKGGRRNGQTLTANQWLCVYAVKVRSGTQYSATASKFILVFDATTPTQTNEATLDGYYGTGNWVYMGLVRYGYGDVGGTTEIIKFLQCRNGWTYFYDNDGGAAYGGLNLEYSNSDGDNTGSPFYTMSTGMSGQVIPDIVGHVYINVSRQATSDWYVDDEDNDTIWRPGWQTDEATQPHGACIELPNKAYKFYQERKGNSAGASRAVTLLGFCDTYRVSRKFGHGI